MSDERQVRPGFLPPQPSGTPPTHGDEPPEAPGGWAPPGPPPPTGPSAERPGGAAPPPSGRRPTFVTGGGPTGPSSPLAITAIVLGSISIVLVVFTLGLAFTLSIVLSGIALAMALYVRRRLRRGAPGRPGQARAAVVVASIALALGVVAAAVWIGLESSGFTPQDLERWLQEELERRQSDGGSAGDRA